MIILDDIINIRSHGIKQTRFFGVIRMVFNYLFVLIIK